MDQVIINQLQFYTPPTLIRQVLHNDRQCLEIAKYLLDKEFKHKERRWKTVAFPEYEDFFQAAVAGFNPYKRSTGAKDKGIIQAIQSYDPYRRQLDVILKELGGIEQAICPMCSDRGEVVSLWPASAGNTTVTSENAPDPVFHKGHKYCGKEISSPHNSILEWLRQDIVRHVGSRYFCNYRNRLASLKNYISNQVGYLIKDIRSAEYHRSRSFRRYPFYPCPQCSMLVADFNISTIHKTEHLVCQGCEYKFAVKDFKGKTSQIVWQARGINSTLSLSDSSTEIEGCSTYEEIISQYQIGGLGEDQAIYHNVVEEERAHLFNKLIMRIRELAASSLSKKQYERLMKDPNVLKIGGIPETQNFKIFYEHFFIDDLNQKQQHLGKAKDAGDESSTYRHLALKYLRKEQHYTECLDCSYRMYEPTESSKFKKAGIRTVCEKCESTNVQYHGPKCGRPTGKHPNCPVHGVGGPSEDTEVVMYIFQTIEPKIRRLEELVRNDQQAQELYERIQELLQAKQDMVAYQDMVKLLNY